MNILEAIRLYLRKCEDDFKRLMRILGREPSLVVSPSLSVLHRNYAIRNGFGIFPRKSGHNEELVLA